MFYRSSCRWPPREAAHRAHAIARGAGIGTALMLADQVFARTGSTSLLATRRAFRDHRTPGMLWPPEKDPQVLSAPKTTPGPDDQRTGPPKTGSRSGETQAVTRPSQRPLKGT